MTMSRMGGEVCWHDKRRVPLLVRYQKFSFTFEISLRENDGCGLLRSSVNIFLLLRQVG